MSGGGARGPRTDDRGGDAGYPQQPGERDLGDRPAAARGYFGGHVDHQEVAFDGPPLG